MPSWPLFRPPTQPDRDPLPKPRRWNSGVTYSLRISRTPSSPPRGSPAWRAVLSPRQPVGEQRHSLGVDRRAVPLQDGGEVRLAFVPARAALPAVPLQEIGGRSESVRGIVNEIRTTAAFGSGRKHQVG